ncbi:MAG TPA: DUF1003 domain-containing protein [Saprospiraceae bacterium]|nr:DUF1003 domain-containing protein [Saprospiraceae bacterium]
MSRISAQNLHKLMETESLQMARLHRIIEETVEEESLISKKVCEENERQQLTFGERIADNVAKFGGSWTFIIIFGVILFIWILLNTIVLANRVYDPYPFILLNLILSCIAALQAPIIMMSQNRQEFKDRARAENDYLINLKAEIEVRHLHEKIDLLMQEQYMQLFEIQRQQLEKLEHLEVELRRLKKEN